MPPFNKKDPYWLIRFLAVAAGEGIAAGWTFMLILLWGNIAGLGDLVHGSPNGAMAVIAMAISFAVTFGVVGIGLRVMFDLPKHIDDGD